MGLTTEKIDAIITAGVKGGAISWAGFRKDAEGRYTLPVVSQQHQQIARAIEVEVRKQDEALIRQLVGALENHQGNYKLTDTEATPVVEAIAAGRARLEQT